MSKGSKLESIQPTWNNAVGKIYAENATSMGIGGPEEPNPADGAMG